MVAAVVLALIVLSAIFAPYLAPVDPFKGSMLRRLKPIGFRRATRLGGDELGRDMLSSRLIYGGAALAVHRRRARGPLAFVIGLPRIGIFAGYVGGRVNTLIMRT